MWARITSPASSQSGYRTSEGFNAENVTVISACTPGEGTSTATTVALGKSSAMLSITARYRPSTGFLTPVPRSASTTISTSSSSSFSSFQSCSFRTTVGGYLSAFKIFRFVLASPLTSSSDAKRKMKGKQPFCTNCRATTKPSPPLFPLPQRTAAVSWSRSSNRSSRTSATRIPAFSIRMRLGIPYFSVERRSTSRSCSGVRIFMDKEIQGQTV